VELNNQAKHAVHNDMPSGSNRTHLIFDYLDAAYDPTKLPKRFVISNGSSIYQTRRSIDTEQEVAAYRVCEQQPKFIIIGAQVSDLPTADATTLGAGRLSLQCALLRACSALCCRAGSKHSAESSHSESMGFHSCSNSHWLWMFVCLLEMRHDVIVRVSLPTSSGKSRQATRSPLLRLAVPVAVRR
jgi:hypothetical protein